MAERTYICSYGVDPSIDFYIEAEYISKNYSAKTKDVQVRITAESGYDGIATLSANGSCGVGCFGKSYSLPSSIKFAKGINLLTSFTVYGVSDELYTSAAIAELTLSYTSDAYGTLSGQSKVTFSLPKMHYSPSLRLKSTRVALGSPIVFYGETLADGISFEVGIGLKGEPPLALGTVSGEGGELPTLCEWIERHGNATEFEAVITVYGGELPSGQEIDVTLYLDGKDGAPTFTVETDYVSESEVAAALPYGVKNRSSLLIRVKDIECKYGATLADYYIVYNGRKYRILELDTGILTDTAPISYPITVKDSRGFESTFTVVSDVREYAPPEFTASVYRSDGYGYAVNDGTSVSVKALLTKSFPFDGSNAYRFSFFVTNADQSTVIDETEIAEGSIYVADEYLDPYDTYTVTVICTDSIGSVTECKYLLEAIRVELNIAKNRIGIGKYADTERLLDCAWGIRSESDISFTDRSGREVSLSECLSGSDGMLTYKCYEVATAEALTEALTAERDGVFLSLIHVGVSGLAIGQGVHAVLKYLVNGHSGYVQL